VRGLDLVVALLVLERSVVEDLAVDRGAADLGLGRTRLALAVLSGLGDGLGVRLLLRSLGVALRLRLGLLALGLGLLRLALLGLRGVDGLLDEAPEPELLGRVQRVHLLGLAVDGLDDLVTGRADLDQKGLQLGVVTRAERARGDLGAAGRQGLAPDVLAGVELARAGGGLDDLLLALRLVLGDGGLGDGGLGHGVLPPERGLRASLVPLYHGPCGEDKSPWSALVLEAAQGLSNHTRASGASQ